MNDIVDFPSGSLAVFGTPALIALMEAAAVNAVNPAIDSAETTVGTQVNVSHIAASGKGMKIRVCQRYCAFCLTISGRSCFGISTREKT